MQRSKRPGLAFALLSFWLSILPAQALDLEISAIGGKVYQGFDEKPTMEQIALLKQEKNEEASLRVREKKEILALAQLASLKKLSLTYYQMPPAPPAEAPKGKNEQSKYRDDTLTAFSSLAQLKNLTELDITLDGRDINADFILAEIAKLPKLTKLKFNCYDPDWTKGYRIVIPKLSTLRQLSLDGSSKETYRFAKDFQFASLKSLDVQDWELEIDQTEIAQMKNLVELKIPKRQISVSLARAMASMSGMETFSGRYTNTLDLSKWSKLRSLELTDTPEAKLATIARLSNLETLELSMNNCSDRELKSLAGLSKLESFSLSLENQEGAKAKKPASGLASSELSGTCLAEFKNCPQLSSLSISGIAHSSSYMKALGQLGQLRNLTLTFTSASPSLSPQEAAYLSGLSRLEKAEIPMAEKKKAAVLKEIRGWTSLKELDLDFEELCDSDLALLEQFPGLVRLKLQGNKLTDAGLEKIAGLRSLRILNLSENPIEGKELARIFSIPDLQELYLNKTKITGQSLKQAKLASKVLQILELSGNKFSGDELEALSGFSSLKRLGLAGTGINDETLKHLSLPGLELIQISSTEITEHGIEDLSKRIPTLKQVIAYDSGIKYGASLAGLELAYQSGWYEYDFDDKKRAEDEHKLQEFMVRLRLGKGKIEELNRSQLAEFYKASGKYKEAVSEYDLLLDDLLHPKYYVCSLMATGRTHRIFEVYDARGMALAAFGQYEKALDDLNKAVSIAKASAYARSHRAYVLYKLGKLREAKLDLDRAIDLNPKLAIAYHYRADVLKALGNEADAERDLKRSLELSYKPEFVPSLSDQVQKKMPLSTRK